jgi:hypothetical protein
VRTGRESNIVVIDVDPRHGGKESLRSLLESLGELPGGPVARTGGGGWHLLFRHPGREVPSRSGIAPGIDIRGDGGLFIAPPSIHRSGNSYCWQVPPTGVPLPELPPKWVEFLAIGPTCYTECAESTESAEYAEHTEYSEITMNTPEVAPTPSLAADKSTLVSDAIHRSLPAKTGQRHAKIFELVRRLKAIPELADKPAQAMLEIVEQWHKLALPNIGTKDFGTTWADFQFGWEEAKYVWGTGPVEEIFAKALLEEPPAKVVALYGRNSLRTQLAALCRALQREAGDGPFFLSTRQVAEVLKVSAMHGGRWLRKLCDDGLLEQVTKGRLKEHQASEFRYLGD